MHSENRKDIALHNWAGLVQTDVVVNLSRNIPVFTILHLLVESMEHDSSLLRSKNQILNSQFPILNEKD